MVPSVNLLALPLVLFSTTIHAMFVPDLTHCDPTCDTACATFTKHSLQIDGDTHSSMDETDHFKVTYDSKVICPEQEKGCHAGQSCDFTLKCIDGWSFKLPDQAIRGPWKYDIQGLPVERYTIGDEATAMDVSKKAFECDGYNCGGKS